jgi:hypothetical protein
MMSKQSRAAVDAAIKAKAKVAGSVTANRAASASRTTVNRSASASRTTVNRSASAATNRSRLTSSGSTGNSSQVRLPNGSITQVRETADQYRDPMWTAELIKEDRLRRAYAQQRAAEMARRNSRAPGSGY